MIITIGLVYFQLNDDAINPESKVDLVKTESELQKSDVKSKNKIKPKPKLDEALLHIAQLISPPSDKELKDTWENEYTCIEGVWCKPSYFNAKSYEDALWLKRKGYPSRSMVELLRDVSRNDLHELSNNSNVNASSLLAIDAMNRKDYRKAKLFARAASSDTGRNSRETFGYRLMADAMLSLNDPMPATLYLRMASILGDTNATATYERITAGTASLVIDSTNRIAYSYLLDWLNTDINNLNNDPRPTDHGGG